MKCPFCNHENEDNANYCANCGEKINLENQSMKNSKYTESYNDYFEEQTQDDFHQDIYRQDIRAQHSSKGFKNKTAWIVLIVICLIIGLFNIDLKRSRTHHQPLQNENNYKYNYKEIEGKYLGNDEITQKNHIIKGGEVISDDQHIYMINESGQIVSFDENLTNEKLIYDGICSYLQIENDYLYFKDEANEKSVIQYNLKTETYETILTLDAYYLYVDDDVLYYQNDGDHESIYSYNLITKENIKLVDEASYNLQADDEYLYYTTANGIQKLDLNTLEKSAVLPLNQVYSMVYDDDEEKFYYVNGEDGYLYSYDEKSDAAKRLNREITLEFVLTDDEIYYINFDNEIINMKRNGSENQWVDNEVHGESLYILNDYIVFYDLSSKQWMEMDLNGESHRALFNTNQNGKYI